MSLISGVGWFLLWRGVEAGTVLGVVALLLGLTGPGVLLFALSYRRRLRDQGRL
ncbi:hypothetical protein ACI3EY_07935 [Ornithinimicrobium sp. LYQ92]|uniref:hypothetical protein n=1 Tax=Serinicoccus sp. LYQ92 TaxID=3378798 RepID=UPI00385314A2